MKKTLIVLLALAANVFLSAAQVEAVPMLSALPFVTANVGDVVTISISISGTSDLTSWQFDLAFNPAIVKANSVTEGPFMSNFGITLFIPGVIDNVTGLISLNADSYVDVPPDPFGDGVLADIEFTALAPGVSPLTFSNVFLNLSDGGFDISNGQITVTGTRAVPEQTTLILLTTGLALLGGRRLARRRRRDEF